MRNHNLILRQIARDNLDPKIAYVVGKNGKLVPKTKKEETKDAIVDPSFESENLKSELSIQGSDDFIVPEGAKSIPESLEESLISKDSVSTKKKSFPAKKKSKSEVTSE